MKIHLIAMFIAAAMVAGCERGPKADVVIGTGAGEAHSLAEAVGMVRERRSRGELKDRAAIIAVKAGRYRADTPVTLTPADSGLRIVGVGVERSVFDGGVELPPFKVAANGVWETEVPHGTEFDQVWVGGERAQLARSPNRYYYYMRDICYDALDTAFLAFPNDIAPLAKLPKDELNRVTVAFWQSWDMGYTKIKAADFKNGRLDFKIASKRSFFFWHKTLPRYAIENFRAALDAPGEWFHDIKAGKLLYIPRNGETPDTARAVIPVAKSLVMFDGDATKDLVVRDISFEGIGFEHTALPIGDGIGNHQAASNVKDAAIAGKGVDGLRFVNCRVAHTGAHGMMLLDGSRRVTIEHSIFEDLGAGAIGFSGRRVTKSEKEINEFLTVRDSIIRQGGRVVQGAIGVWIGNARDCLVEHNDIYDFFYTGISCGWTWGYATTINRRNRIAFNRVHHIGKGVLSDMGAIYTLGDNSGSVVCNNWVSDVDGYSDNGAPAFGMYTDEGSHGFLFASNLVENCRYSALHQHYGRGNAFENNICVGFEQNAVLRSRAEPHTTMMMTNNIFLWHTPETVAYTGQGSFESMLKDLPTDGNVYWCSGGAVTNTAFMGKDFVTWQQGGNDRHGVIADPLFVDPERGDWNLHADSPALKAGFKSFDWKAAGVLKNDASWLAKSSERTWEDYQKLPTAPAFSNSRYEFDPEKFLKGTKTNISKALFVDHVGRNGAFTMAPDAKAVRFTDSKEEARKFAPHLSIKPMVNGDKLIANFVFRLVSGVGFAFEIRDYSKSKLSYQTGLKLSHERGALCVNGKSVMNVVPGEWIEAALEMDTTGVTKTPATITLRRADGEMVVTPVERWLSREFKQPTWYGFVTVGDDTAVWDLKSFSVKKKDK